MIKYLKSFCLTATNLKELAELTGHQAPCKKCIVQATCYESYIDDDNGIVIDLKDPCEDAVKWFITASYIDDEIYHFLRKKDGSLLSSGDIITIIKYWYDPDVFLEEKTGIPASVINRIGKYINGLDKYYCWTEEIDIEENIILKDTIEEALKYFKN
jgi:hypothetical protein